MKSFLIIFIVTIYTLISINAIAIDDFHCKVPTCRDFYYGLSKYPRFKHYVDVCYDTVFALQSIPTKHGQCINSKTGKLHPPCIYALVKTIQTCMKGLIDLPENEAKHYCGYTLMKYCSVHLGLDQIPFDS